MRDETTTAFVDRFVLDRLPPRELWPERDWTGVPELAYPASLNCTTALLDERIARGDGERTAFLHEGGTWSYRRVYETANRIANVLVHELGLVPGNRVLLRSPNHPMLAACWLAVLRAGGVAVTTMPLLRQRELAEIVERAGIRLALTDARVADDLEAVLAGRSPATLVRFGSEAPGALEARMARHSPALTPVATQADDPALIAFSSGTTGRVKAVVHSHRDVLAVTDTYGRHVLRPQPDDIFIGSPPLAFTYALGGLVLFPLRFGASAVLLEQASPPHMLAGIQQHRATVTITSPTGYRAMLRQAAEFDLSSLRAGVSAGETLPAAVFDAWEQATGIRLMDGIGSTELLHVFIGCTAEAARRGATGLVVPGYRAKVIDEDGAEVPRGTIGRLAVVGPTGCRYLADPENQRKYVQRGWNVTGDAYLQDADGYFWYQCRTDDMIVSSGYNISGAEVENVLLSHPAVAECAVVGVPDETRGRIVKAVIVPAAGATPSDALVQSLQDFVKSQIAPYKYPRAIQFVEALPRTLTGKVQRFRLRQGAGDAAPAPTPQEVPVTVHQPEGWPRPSGYANAVSATGRQVFVAGQVGWDPLTCDFATTSFPDQVRQALRNVVAALAAAGARPEHVTRLTWYVTSRELYTAHLVEIGAAYREVMGRHYPAMSVVVVAGLVEPGALVEIEATAVVRGG